MAPTTRRGAKLKAHQRIDKGKASTKPNSTSEKPTLYFGGLQILLLILGLALGIAYGFYYTPQKGAQESPITEPALPFTVIEMPGKGKGAIAIRDIAQGELIIRERPLFLVPRSTGLSPTELISGMVKGLSKAGREAFLNLSYVNFPKDKDPATHPDHVALAIFETNSVASGDKVGIFPRMARLNHGCSGAFNSVYTWREKEGALVVHALKPISKGDELLTTYTNSRQPRDQRRTYLSQNYGFHCTCGSCSLPDPLSRASDARLATISDEYTRFATWAKGDINGPQAIGHVRKIWEIEDEEGYWSERGRLAADAVWVAAGHSDAVAVREWARVSIQWYSYELGSDSKEVEEMEEILGSPGLHAAWSTRERMDVGGPSWTR